MASALRSLTPPDVRVAYHSGSLKLYDEGCTFPLTERTPFFTSRPVLNTVPDYTLLSCLGTVHDIQERTPHGVILPLKKDGHKSHG